MTHYIDFNDGNKVPVMGIGVYGLDSEQTLRITSYALEKGYRHIDTAAFYENEKEVGKAVRNSGIKREDIFVTTKIWNTDIRQRTTKQAFEISLNNLGLDYLDLYLVHWPADGFLHAYEDMMELQEKGLIKSIGVSNFEQNHLDELLKHFDKVPAMNQIESHPVFPNTSLIDYCTKKGIRVTAWKPIGGSRGNLFTEEKIVELAKKYGKTPAQIMIRWHIDRGVIPIPRTTKEKRVVENIDVFDFELSNDDMLEIATMDRNYRMGEDPQNFYF